MVKIADVNIGNQTLFNTPWGHAGGGVADFVSVILYNAVALSGIILLFLFVFGGITLIIGAGQGNPEAAARGKKALTSAVIGFLLIFTSYWIIQIVQIITGIHILSPNP